MGQHIDEHGTILSGRFGTETVEDVAAEYPTYLKFALDNWGLDADERALVEKALADAEEAG